MQDQGRCKGSSVKGPNELHQTPASVAHALTRKKLEGAFMICVEHTVVSTGKAEVEF